MALYEKRESMGKDYIKWIRSQVGHEKVILVFAGGCIFNEEGMVLVQRRKDSHQWGFPGGAIEIGETPEMAAIREIKEETGLVVEVEDLIGIYTDYNMIYSNGDQAQSICIVYKLKAKSGTLSCDHVESIELKYFPINGLPDMFCQQHEEIKRDLVKKFS